MFDSDFLKSLGIIDWGYTEESRPSSFERYNNWASEGHAGPLTYLTDHRKGLREDICHIFPEFQGALVFLFDYSVERREIQNFYQSEKSNGLKIASYALGFEGRDYHEVITEKLGKVQEKLSVNEPGLKTQISLDIHPVLERDLAYRAGLGWFGKNSMMISRKHGSFFMIGGLLLNKKLSFKKKALEIDHCGQCRLCVDACPTMAIDPESRTLIANKCISTFTIEEFKEDKVAPPGLELGKGEFFGCDICQDVCPWNERPFRNHKVRTLWNNEESEESKKVSSFFLTRPLSEIVDELKSWSNKKYRRFFKGTALERTGRVGVLKNLLFYFKDTDDL